VKRDIIIGYKNGEPIMEEGVLITTADPRITGKIYEIEGKYVVLGESPGKVKWFNKLQEAIAFCQPRMVWR
jgi:hypothetical protein